MQTQARPSDTRPGPQLPAVLIAGIAMGIGVVMTVLGIYEIGGLLSLGLGLLVTFVSSIPLILHPGAGERGIDDELRRMASGR
jgi:hypothetical protein